MRNSAEAAAFKAACVAWLSSGVGAYDIALTLNFRRGIKRHEAEAAAKQFWHRVDCAVYGSKAKRKGLRVHRVCVLEGDGWLSNLHFHAAVVLPQQWQLAEFQQFLINAWEQFQEAGRFSDVQPCYDSQGWLDYICKRMKDSTDVLCLATSHIPA